MKLDSHFNSLTIKDLLLMAGGWKDVRYTSLDPTFGPILSDLQRRYHVKPPLSCYRAARFMLGLPANDKPGTTFGYANINYCYLGLVISKINHLPFTATAYETYIQQHILHPLGITDMTLGSTEKTHTNEVHYYAKPATTQFPYSHGKILQKTYPFAAWLASPLDLVKLTQGLPTLLNKKQLAFITSKSKNINYQYSKHDQIAYFYSSGWWLYPEKQQLVWLAHGSFTGSMTMIEKRAPATIIAISFNALPHPIMPAYRKLRKLLSSL